MCIHAPSFQQPFHFDWNSIGSLRSTDADGRPNHAHATTGAISCELVSGDCLTGDLVELTATELVLDVADAGRLHLATERVLRLGPTSSGHQHVYRGPKGLAEWAQNEPAAWREEGGGLLAQQPEATISANVGLPSSACVEVELAWTDTAIFSLHLGVDPAADQVSNALSLET